ncbi:MAG: hypothetical protein ACJAZS_000596 [Alteromonas naphthalenivorans]|jgi:hypothetical protein
MVNDNQLTVSYELLYLIQWLLENESDGLKKLIGQALHNGLKHDLQEAVNSDLKNTDDIQYSIVDFLALMEGLLHESISEQNMQRILEKKLMPAIDNIDSKECDKATVDFSVEKATFKLESNPEENPQDILFQELLKCWKPTKKTITH